MYKVVKEGKGGISAKIVADSVNDNGNRVTTYELEYHRFIHGEVMTHRLFSRNAMSSRAVPVSKMIEQSNTTPIHFGKKQSGMQADHEHEDVAGGKQVWENAREDAIHHATLLEQRGYHKQIVNRLLEPFQMMKVVLTATEFENFFWLRCDKDAQPEIQELAGLMYEALKESTPEKLKVGDWHTPYVGHLPCMNGFVYTVDGYTSITQEEAIAISSSCCAQVSYRNIDNSFNKAMAVYERLGVGGNKIHASPFEHVATPMRKTEMDYTDAEEGINEDGVTHMDTEFQYWSGNFKGWIQHRQQLDNHTKW